MPNQADRAKAISTALIALDIGLAIQHFVDPDDVPVDLYPKLYVLLFGSVALQERRPQNTNRTRREPSKRKPRKRSPPRTG